MYKQNVTLLPGLPLHCAAQVEVANLRGFMPASQVNPRVLKEGDLVGRTLPAKFIEASTCDSIYIGQFHIEY